MTPPHDLAAERAVVGVCLHTRYGVVRIAQCALRTTDFYLPRHASLYAACEAMGDVVGREERLAFAMAFSDVTEAHLRSLVSEAPVMFDATPWAARVAECAKRRAAMHRCVAAYEALRDGGDVDEAMAWS